MEHTADLSSLESSALLKLLQSLTSEYTKRQKEENIESHCKVLLFVETYTIELLDVDTTKLVRQLKEEVEEQTFKVGDEQRIVTGPSAKWRYYCNDEEALDDLPLATYLDEEEGAVCFTVIAPKKRQRQETNEEERKSKVAKSETN